MATLTANGQAEQFIGENGRVPRRKGSGFRNGQVEKNTTVNGNKTTFLEKGYSNQRKQVQSKDAISKMATL